MNERIEKLALECYQAPEFDYKKFAELIVRECIGQFIQHGVVSADGTIVKDIQKHFGVEE
jgi:hypothetical protein